jgi:endonuclease-8
MPEGHLLHRYALAHRLLAGSAVAASSPQGRFATGAAAIDGQVLDSVEAHGKHLLHRFTARWVHTHLGMRGVWAELPTPPPDARPQARLRLSGEAATWDLFAPSVCELLDADGVARLLAGIGPDPLRRDDPAATRERLSHDERAIGEAMLDQALFAGCGNVLRAEVLAARGIDPRTTASTLDDSAFAGLWSELTDRMRAAVAAGAIDKHVYKHETCRRCRAPVEVFDLPRGRTVYRCTGCQAT